MKRKRYNFGGKTFLDLPNPVATLAEANRKAAMGNEERNNAWYLKGLDALGNSLLSSGINTMAGGVRGILARHNLSEGAQDIGEGFSRNIGQLGQLGLNAGLFATGGVVPIEAEGGEMMQLPQEEMALPIDGASHEQGGVDMNVPQGTIIYSKRIKDSKGKTMAQRKERRDKMEATLLRKLQEKPSDKILKMTYERVVKNNAIEDASDIALMEQIHRTEDEVQRNKQLLKSYGNTPLLPTSESNVEGYAYGGKVSNKAERLAKMKAAQDRLRKTITRRQPSPEELEQMIESSEGIYDRISNAGRKFIDNLKPIQNPLNMPTISGSGLPQAGSNIHKILKDIANGNYLPDNVRDALNNPKDAIKRLISRDTAPMAVEDETLDDIARAKYYPQYNHIPDSYIQNEIADWRKRFITWDDFLLGGGGTFHDRKGNQLEGKIHKIGDEVFLVPIDRNGNIVEDYEYRNNIPPNRNNPLRRVADELVTDNNVKDIDNDIDIDTNAHYDLESRRYPTLNPYKSIVPGSFVKATSDAEKQAIMDDMLGRKYAYGGRIDKFYTDSKNGRTYYINNGKRFNSGIEPNGTYVHQLSNTKGPLYPQSTSNLQMPTNTLSIKPQPIISKDTMNMGLTPNQVYFNGNIFDVTKSNDPNEPGTWEVDGITYKHGYMPSNEEHKDNIRKLKRTNKLNNIADIISKDSGAASFGDALAIGGTIYNSLIPLRNAQANFAGKEPYRNYYKDYGKRGIDSANKSFDTFKIQRDNSLRDLLYNTKSQLYNIDNNSRDINVSNALKLSALANINRERNNVLAQYANQISGQHNRLTDLYNNRDQAVMSGDREQDINNRGLRDAYYNAIGNGQMGIGTGLQQIGKQLNERMLNEFYKKLYNNLLKFNPSYAQALGSNLKMKTIGYTKKNNGNQSKRTKATPSSNTSITQKP